MNHKGLSLHLKTSKNAIKKNGFQPCIPCKQRIQNVLTLKIIIETIFTAQQILIVRSQFAYFVFVFLVAKSFFCFSQCFNYIHPGRGQAMSFELASKRKIRWKNKNNSTNRQYRRRRIEKKCRWIYSRISWMIMQKSFSLLSSALVVLTVCFQLNTEVCFKPSILCFFFFLAKIETTDEMEKSGEISHKIKKRKKKKQWKSLSAYSMHAICERSQLIQLFGIVARSHTTKKKVPICH